jgi:NitT/TauT family transport system substrate-binding protein
MFKRSFVVILLMLTAAVGRAQETPAETFLLNFIPNIQYAPFYVAQASGLYEANGVSIEYDYLDEPVVLDLVAANQNALGMVSGEQVILGRAEERPVTFVYEWYQEYPIGVVFSTDSGIESVEDLTDVRVGLPGRFGASYSALTTMLEGAGLSESDITLEEIGYNAPEVICVGGVDAAVVYINNEPLQIRERAASGDCDPVEGVAVIPVASVTDLVSNGIITNETTLAERPERVEAVVAAFDEALRLSINNPARAYLQSIDFIEGLPAEPDFVAALEAMAAEQDAFLATEPDANAITASRAAMLTALQDEFGTGVAIQFEVLLETIPLWEAEQLGFSDIAAWENMQATLLSLGLIEEATDLEGAFTNAYLPE